MKIYICGIPICSMQVNAICSERRIISETYVANSDFFVNMAVQCIVGRRQAWACERGKQLPTRLLFAVSYHYSPAENDLKRDTSTTTHISLRIPPVVARWLRVWIGIGICAGKIRQKRTTTTFHQRDKYLFYIYCIHKLFKLTFAYMFSVISDL